MAISASQINDLYKSHLGRSADKGGLEYWQKVAQDHGLDYVKNALSSSEEAKKYADTGNAITVDMDDRVDGFEYRGGNSGQSDVFQQVMDVFVSNTGRADSDEVSDWVSRINSGSATLEQLTASLAGGTSQPSTPAPAPPQTSVSDEQTSQGQLDNILASDSPLMQRAASQGMQVANSRGLLNSSMASQASQGAMIDRASPLAQQDAQTHFQNSQANANRRQQAYLSNLQYQQSLGLNEQQHRFQTELNDQQYGYQTGLNEQQHGFDLDRLHASSMANAWGVMANSVTDIVAQGMEGIANIQANPDIKPEDKTAMIEQILEMRDTDIVFQQDLYESLATYLSDTGLFPSL